MTIKKFKSINISGFKLVVSTVSTGNVAQLATDLFIESLKMEKFAMIWNSAIIPIIGPAAFEKESGGLTTASEMFISEKDKLVILQTRTPLTAAVVLEGYIHEVVKFAQEEKVSEMIILTSSFSHEQHFIEKNPFEFKVNDFMVNKNVAGFAETSKDFQIPGSGISKMLFQKATEASVPSVILYKFVSEGDNFFDGIQLCQKINEVLKIIPSASDGKPEIKIPISWKFLFGRNVNPEIY